MSIDTNLPQDVQNDLDNGFILTDPDNAYQRCKTISETVFHYKSGTTSENDLIEATINVEALDETQKEDVVSSYYGSVAALTEEMKGDVESINMLIAECFFEMEHEQPTGP